MLELNAKVNTDVYADVIYYSVNLTNRNMNSVGWCVKNVDCQ